MTRRRTLSLFLAMLGSALAACGGGGGGTPAGPPPPVITTILPASGPEGGGTQLAISGSGFTAPATVTVGGVPASMVDVTSASLITCFTAPGVGGATVDVVVTTPVDSLTRTGAFTYIATPTVTSVMPNMGPAAGGTPVTVTGTGFLADTKATFGGIPADNVIVMDDTTFTCTTPAGVGAVDVTATTAGGPGTLAAGFTYQAVPLQGKYGAEGTLHVAWSEPPALGGRAEVRCLTSRDGGQTWLLPDVRIDDVPGTAVREILDVVCRAHGVCVAWREVLGPEAVGRVYYSYSTDGGATWRTTDVRLDVQLDDADD